MSGTAFASEFLGGLGFLPDAFQIEAASAIDAAESVVVTAPTGAGKTVVAHAAIARAFGLQRRAFYTTPIKALSNQKFADLVDMYGATDVGLLTGDNVINADARVVVMTTEVLRNMIYADSTALTGLGVVILDEVHYLADPERGSVWEEVVIHLDKGVQFVNLSATIANAQEFTGWIRARRGPTTLIQEMVRPVPLDVVYMISDKHRNRGLITEPVFASGGTRPNSAIVKLLKRGRGRERRFRTPRRRETVDELNDLGLLPTIIFVFSRAGCDQAARDIATARITLTNAEQRDHIRRRAEQLTSHLSPSDLAVVGYATWLKNLEAGVASHHAGMIPAFKETVEDLFVSGYLRVVFATETLAMGINMPARSVVIEKLSKFTGQGHELLKPGDFTQLTGRAGRRGIDTQGTAVVLHTAHVPFDRVVAIAGAGSHPLRSSFRPSYNMVVNMIAKYDRDEATRLLQASFAQFTIETHSESMRMRVAKLERDVAAWTPMVECDQGDVRQWAETAAETGDLRSQLDDFVTRLDIGDVLERPAPGGGFPDRWAVLALGFGASPRVTLITEDGTVRRTQSADLGRDIAVVGEIRFPEPFRPTDTRFQRRVGSALRAWRSDGRDAIRLVPTVPGPDVGVVTCVDFDNHLSALAKQRHAEKDLRRLNRRILRVDTTVLDAFEAMMSLLEDRRFISGWALQEKGQRLRLLSTELDLLLTEALDNAVFDNLTSAEFAAMVSVFVYEPRRVDIGGGPPSRRVHRRVDALWDIVDSVQIAERSHDVSVSRDPEVGFAELVYAWVEGSSLADLFGDEDIVIGDFVRTCRQVIDLIRQIRDGYPTLSNTARGAISAMDRGVVAAGGRA